MDEQKTPNKKSNLINILLNFGMSIYLVALGWYLYQNGYENIGCILIIIGCAFGAYPKILKLPNNWF